MTMILPGASKYETYEGKNVTHKKVSLKNKK